MFWKLFSKFKNKQTKSFDELWSELVPEKGQADTIQGEIIRCYGCISDEFLSNGCANWDVGFEIMADYLLNHLTDGTFGKTTSNGITTDIEEIKNYGRGEEVRYDLEAAIDRLETAVIAWQQKHPMKEKHYINDNLLR